MPKIIVKFIDANLRYSNSHMWKLQSVYVLSV